MLGNLGHHRRLHLKLLTFRFLHHLQILNQFIQYLIQFEHLLFIFRTSLLLLLKLILYRELRLLANFWIFFKYLILVYLQKVHFLLLILRNRLLFIGLIILLIFLIFLFSNFLHFSWISCSLFLSLAWLFFILFYRNLLSIPRYLLTLIQTSLTLPQFNLLLFLLTLLLKVHCLLNQTKILYLLQGLYAFSDLSRHFFP